MKFSNPFKRKENPEMIKAYEAFAQSTKNKREMAEKIIQMMDAIRLERRMGTNGYEGPERRMA